MIPSASNTTLNANLILHRQIAQRTIGTRLQAEAAGYKHAAFDGRESWVSGRSRVCSCHCSLRAVGESALAQERVGHKKLVGYLGLNIGPFSLGERG